MSTSNINKPAETNWAWLIKEKKLRASTLLSDPLIEGG